MSSMVTITDLQTRAPRIVRDTEKRGVTAITRHGRAVAFLMSKDRMEALLETLELQRSEELMTWVREDRAGRVKYHPLASLDED